MIVDILIVSSIYDFSTDLVTQELEKRGINYLRLNKEHFSDYRITLSPDKLLMVVEVYGATYTVDGSVRSVFYRQPVFLRNTPGEALSIKEQLVRSQWMGFLRSLSIFENAKWLNWPESTYLAETKAYQLSLANKLGFTIPETKIGNNIKEFNSMGDKIILKSLDTILLREGSDCLFTYSTIENNRSLCDKDVADAPLTVQEYIYPKADIRVTVIENSIFAIRITNRGKKIDEDWRLINREELEYTDIELPKPTKQLCLKLVRSLNLSFGAIDLIESNGKYIFIEINPTGEWGWKLSENRRIDSCIVDCLIGTT